MKLFNANKYKIPKIWFYEIKGVHNIATLKEIETAKQLPKFRACIFLETRAYVRKSLAELFELDPLNIPLIANPGEPPELPLGMGHISFSHCNDAFVIVWYKKKIGIDIERKDRIFNYKQLSEKYFSDVNKSKRNKELTKNMILNRWCAVEAATKWDHGQLPKDINYWQYYEENKELIHKKKNLHLKFSQINYYDWNIAIAYKKNTSLDNEIICSSKKI